jgi:hypothetical protein
MSNSDTLTRARKARPRAAKPSASNGHAKPFWYEPSIAARTAIVEALAAAFDHEFDDENESTDALRVAGAARTPAETMVFDGFPALGESDMMFRNDIAGSAYDICAFMVAALNYPGQPFCIARALLLQRAHRIAAALATLNVSGQDQSMVDAVYAAIEQRADAPQPKATPLRAASWADRYDPCVLLMQACDISEAAAIEAADDATYGVHSLIKKASDSVFTALAGQSSPSADLIQAASDELAGALGVVRAINDDGLDCSLLYVTDTLLRLAKDVLDELAVKAVSK